MTLRQQLLVEIQEGLLQDSILLFLGKIESFLDLRPLLLNDLIAMLLLLIEDLHGQFAVIIQLLEEIPDLLPVQLRISPHHNPEISFELLIIMGEGEWVVGNEMMFVDVGVAGEEVFRLDFVGHEQAIINAIISVQSSHTFQWQLQQSDQYISIGFQQDGQLSEIMLLKEGGKVEQVMKELSWKWEIKEMRSRIRNGDNNDRWGYQSRRQYLTAKLSQRAKILSGKITSFVLIAKNKDSPFVCRISFAFCCSSSCARISFGSSVVSWIGKALKVCLGGIQFLIANWNSSSQKVLPVTRSISQLESAVDSRVARISSQLQLSFNFARYSLIKAAKEDSIFCQV